MPRRKEVIYGKEMKLSNYAGRPIIMKKDGGGFFMNNKWYSTYKNYRWFRVWKPKR